jgi:putative Ca2+/H+ antiporter (TMEM165/GDT1 family)
MARMLLVVSAALQVVTFSLPWEHVNIVGAHIALDYSVSTFITDVPVNEVLYAFRSVGLATPHPMLAAVFWDVFWRGALLFIGFWLVLAFCLAKRWALRWLLAVLYGLWLVYTTVLALSFIMTAHAINTGTYAVSNHPAWWEQYVRVVVTLFGERPSYNPTSPAWGFWLYVGALAMCWLALGLTITALLRSRSAARAVSDEPKRARKLPIAAILVTVGAVVWLASVVALPMAVADCGRPLVPWATGEARRVCQANSAIYPFQLSAYSFFLDPMPVLANTSFLRGDAYSPGSRILGVIGYFRNFGLLVLAMFATPLALVAVWQARATRGRVVWLSAWAVVVLGETGFLLHLTTEVLSTNLHPIFAEGIGLGAVLAPLGAALIVAGVALKWLQMRRDGVGAVRGDTAA